MTNKLKNIRINEISLVDKPATKKKFLFFKRQGETDSKPKLWPSLAIKTGK